MSTITPADTTVNAYNANITSDGDTLAGCTMPAGDYTALAWTVKVIPMAHWCL